jgi:amino acid adenylation domain-containing protein
VRVSDASAMVLPEQVFVPFAQAFEAQARRMPHAPAVVFEGTTLTYAALNARATDLAAHLQAHGARPGQRIGICIERSLATVVSALGVLKTGAAYVPLDPVNPDPRLAYLAEDAGLSLVLSDGVRPHSLFAGAEIVAIDARGQVAAEHPPLPLAPAVSGVDDIAYVLYTSGSTGLPKGVEVRHGGLMNFLCSMAREPGLTAADVVLATTPISFDISGLELFLPLLVGGCAVVAPSAVRTDGRMLAERLAASGATLMQATPSTFRLLLAAGWQGAPGLTLLCGGEAMTRDLADALLPRCGELWNLYGPTETTIWSTLHRVTPGEGPIPIGRAIDRTVLRVLEPAGDAGLRQVPAGRTGELYIGGEGLARGYLNRPELNAKHFIPDPFSSVPGARLYRTGDLVRQRADGNLIYIGRADDQVKVRGFRIEPGEVEAAVLAEPGVQAAAVAARPDSLGDLQLVAYLVPRRSCADHTQLIGQLRANLPAKLPAWMVPTRFAVLDALPLTPNGKVDRRALPVPNDETSLLEAAAYVAPQTDMQRSLLGLWEQLLGLHGFGIRRDFFEIGGHSLLVAEMFGRIEAAFGCHLPLATIFEAPTVEALAARIEATATSSPEVRQAGLVPLRRGKLSPALFLVIAANEDEELYLNLAGRFDDNRSVLAVRAVDDAGCPAVFDRLADFATHLAASIVRLQPQGPYLLGGQCTGGVIAFEIAQQLQRAGEVVDLVVLMEAADSRACPVRGANPLPWHRALRQRLRDAPITLNQLFRDRNARLPGFLRNHRSLSNTRRVLDFARRNHAASGVFHGKVVLLRARAGDGRPSDVPFIEQYRDPLFGWGAHVAGELCVHDVPGGHGSMLEEPHVSHTAAIIQREIAAIYAGLSLSSRREPAEGPLAVVEANA